MSSTNDGGPAFPRTGEVVNKSGDSRDVPGMSLRDYFAGQAMQAMLNTVRMYDRQLKPSEKESDTGGDAVDYCQPYFTGLEQEMPGTLATHAYAIADAMLAARAVKP